MRRTTPVVVVVAVVAATLIGTAALQAQEKSPSLPAVARTAVMSPMPPAPAPGPEVERLSYFIGAWSSTGHIKPSSLGGGGDTRGRESCGWMPGKFFVGCMMQSESPMGRVQTEGIMGWDPDKKLYSWTSFDSTGRRETADGTYENGVWTWSGQTKTGDKLMKTRYVMSDTTPEGYAIRWETSADGKEWKPMMEGKVTKGAPPVKPTAAVGVQTTPGFAPTKAP